MASYSASTANGPRTPDSDSGFFCYPFVSHAFAAVDQGQVGLLNVGGVHGTMSH
jgi:hypothetical protein